MSGVDQSNAETAADKELTQKPLAFVSAQLGSLDFTVAGAALRAAVGIVEKSLAERRDPFFAPTVDLMEIKHRYSPEEWKIIAENIVGRELTSGCSGGCFFCHKGVTKEKVTRKFSLSSICRYLEEDADYFKGKQLLFYWYTDEGDYRGEEDGKRYSFLDVYRKLKEVAPSATIYYSTSIPPGSEEAFAELITYMAVAQRDRNEGPFVSRISLGKQSARRYLTFGHLLSAKMMEAGFSLEMVEKFRNEWIRVEDRYPNSANFEPFKTGPLFRQSRDFTNFRPIGAEDGIVISPDGARASILTLPTIYYPLGEMMIDVPPGQANEVVPKSLDVRNYNFPLFRADYRGKSIVSPVVRHDSTPYLHPDKVQNSVIHLGREVFAWASFLEQLENNFEPHVFDETMLGQVITEVDDRLAFSKGKLLEAKEVFSGVNLSSEEKEKMGYYIALGQLFIDQIDFLRQFMSSNKIDVTFVCAMARVFRRIGRDQYSHLPEIIEAICEARNSIRSDSSEENISRMKAQTRRELREHCGLELTAEGNLPFWAYLIDYTVENVFPRYEIKLGKPESVVCLLVLNDAVDTEFVTSEYIKRYGIDSLCKSLGPEKVRRFSSKAKLSDTGTAGFFEDELPNVLIIKDGELVWDFRDSNQLDQVLRNSGFSQGINELMN